MKTFSYKKYKPVPPRPISKESKTVPDQAMSLKTILKRYANGITPMGIPGEPMYGTTEETSLGIDPRRLDLTEYDKLIKENKAIIDQAKEREDQLIKAKEKERERQAIREELEKEMKPLENQGV